MSKKINRYSEDDVRTLVYYRSVFKPPMKLADVAAKLDRTTSSVSQKSKNLKDSGEWAKIVKDVKAEKWTPLLEQEPPAQLDMFGSVNEVLDKYDSREEKDVTVMILTDYIYMGVGLSIGFVLGLSLALFF